MDKTKLLGLEGEKGEITIVLKNGRVYNGHVYNIVYGGTNSDALIRFRDFKGDIVKFHGSNISEIISKEIVSIDNTTSEENNQHNQANCHFTTDSYRGHSHKIKKEVEK